MTVVGLHEEWQNTPTISIKEGVEGLSAFILEPMNTFLNLHDNKTQLPKLGYH